MEGQDRLFEIIELVANGMIQKGSFGGFTVYRVGKIIRIDYRPEN